MTFAYLLQQSHFCTFCFVRGGHHTLWQYVMSDDGLWNFIHDVTMIWVSHYYYSTKESVLFCVWIWLNIISFLRHFEEYSDLKNNFSLSHCCFFLQWFRLRRHIYFCIKKMLCAGLTSAECVKMLEKTDETPGYKNRNSWCTDTRWHPVLDAAMLPRQPAMHPLFLTAVPMVPGLDSVPGLLLRR